MVSRRVVDTGSADVAHYRLSGRFAKRLSVEMDPVVMTRGDVINTVVGAVEALATYVVARPGEYVFGFGPLRFDPSLAVIAGFACLAVWGIVTSLRRSAAFQAQLESSRFGPTAVAVVLGFALLSVVLTPVTTDLTGVSLVATTVSSTLLTVVAMTGAFVLFRHVGWWDPESENRIRFFTTTPRTRWHVNRSMTPSR